MGHQATVAVTSIVRCWTTCHPCAAMAAQVGQLEADCQGRREQLEPQLAATSERIEPLQGSVAQVRQAAGQVGMAWP